MTALAESILHLSKEMEESLLIPLPGEPEPTAHKAIVAYHKTRDEEGPNKGESILAQTKIPASLGRVIDELIQAGKSDQSLPYLTKSDFYRDAIFQRAVNVYRFLNQHQGYVSDMLTMEKKFADYAHANHQREVMRRAITALMTSVEALLDEGTLPAIEEAISQLRWWVGTVEQIREQEPYWYQRYAREIIRADCIKRLIRSLQNSARYRDQDFVNTLGRWQGEFAKPLERVA